MLDDKFYESLERIEKIESEKQETKYLGNIYGASEDEEIARTIKGLIFDDTEITRF